MPHEVLNMAPKHTFETNAKAFEAKRKELLSKHEGKYALFHDDVFVEVFDTMDAAYAAALDRFKLDPIYIGKVESDPPIEQSPALMLGLIYACP